MRPIQGTGLQSARADEVHHLGIVSETDLQFLLLAFLFVGMFADLMPLDFVGDSVHHVLQVP